VKRRARTQAPRSRVEAACRAGRVSGWSYRREVASSQSNGAPSQCRLTRRVRIASMRPSTMQLEPVTIAVRRSPHGTPLVLRRAREHRLHGLAHHAAWELALQRGERERTAARSRIAASRASARRASELGAVAMKSTSGPATLAGPRSPRSRCFTPWVVLRLFSALSSLPRCRPARRERVSDGSEARPARPHSSSEWR